MLLSFMETNRTSIILLVVMAVLIVALFVGNFFMQKKQKKQAQETMSKLKVGDIVVTIGGIKGTIVDVNESDDTVVIETGMGDNKMTITLFKGAIQNVNPDAPARPASAPAPRAAEETPVKEEPKDEPAEETAEPADEEPKDDEVQH